MPTQVSSITSCLSPFLAPKVGFRFSIPEFPPFTSKYPFRESPIREESSKQLSPLKNHIRDFYHDDFPSLMSNYQIKKMAQTLVRCGSFLFMVDVCLEQWRSICPQARKHRPAAASASMTRPYPDPQPLRLIKNVLVSLSLFLVNKRKMTKVITD